MAPPYPYPPYPYWYPLYPYPYPPPKSLVCYKVALAPPPPPNWHWVPSSRGGWVPHICCNDEPPVSTRLEEIWIEVHCALVEPDPETQIIRYIRLEWNGTKPSHIDGIPLYSLWVLLDVYSWVNAVSSPGLIADNKCLSSMWMSLICFDYFGYFVNSRIHFNRQLTPDWKRDVSSYWKRN